jgi:hypothetical protein
MEITLMIDILVSLAVAYFFLLPRFNQWPKEKGGQFTGRPKSYISDHRYFLFGSIYVLSYLLFAYAISRLGLLGALLPSETLEDPTGLLAPVRKAFGDQSLAVAIILLMGGVKILPQLQDMDEKWRGYLLDLARVPEDALDLKYSILTALEHSLPDGKRTQNLLELMRRRDQHAYWENFEFSNPGFDPHAELKVLLLKNAYLAQANRSFDLNQSDRQDLTATDELINTTAAALPPLDLEQNPDTFYEYKSQLSGNLKMLAEMLARNTVRSHSNRAAQLVRIRQLGLDIDYLDQTDLRSQLLKPAAMIIFGLLAINLVVISLGLQLFDWLKIGPPPDLDSWFTRTRAIRWAMGSWVSLSVAIFFGLFFYETMNSQTGKHRLLGQMLAFCFASLGSGLYFMVSSAQFLPSHLWLSVSFGIMAIVTMHSCAVDAFNENEIHKNATVTSLIYAALVAVLQMLILLTLHGPENLGLRDASVWFAFGFIKALPAAYLVAYTFMDFQMHRSFEGRRKSPRVPYHKRITALYNQTQTEILVKDISCGGALVRFPENQAPRAGLPLVMDFDFASVPGEVIWADARLARVRFDSTSPALVPLKEKMQESIGLQYHLAAA